MIENIYSEENQGNRQKETAKSCKIPKNIRQIGQPQDNLKIYAEDYVITFIRQLAEKESNTYQMAILLGETVAVNEIRYIFIKGAVEVKDVTTEEELLLNQGIWSEIYEEIKKYFSDAEIVGWMLARSGISWENEDRFKKIHLDNFSGQDKVFLTYDPIEKEETFFLYKAGSMKKQRGYYIYYERNIEMQNYLVERHNGESTEQVKEKSADKAAKSARKVIEKKQKDAVKQKGKQGWYTLGGAIAATFILASAYAINNPEQWQQIQDTMSGISNQNVSTSKNESKEVDNAEVGKSTPVEIADGNVTTIKQETVIGDRTESDNKQNETVSKEAIGTKEPIESTTEPQDSKEETNNTTEQGGNVDDIISTTGKNKENIENEVKTELQNYYEVKKGDTLASISMKLYNTMEKVNELQELNEIENIDEIYIGQKIILPSTN